MWERLRGKYCKFVIRDGGEIYAVHGTVIDANSSFIVEKDRFGKLHFLSTEIIEKIHERVEGKDTQKVEMQKTEP